MSPRQLSYLGGKTMQFYLNGKFAYFSMTQGNYHDCCGCSASCKGGTMAATNNPITIYSLNTIVCG